MIKMYLGQFAALMLLVGSLSFGCGYMARRDTHACPNVERVVYPTVRQMQEFLGVEVDGVPGTETDAKWIAWSKANEFNQNAIETSGGLYNE